MSAAALIADCQKRLDRLRGGGGWFTSGGGALDHGTYRSVISQYHERVYYEGRVAWGAVVQANESLYVKGDWDSTGALVYSFDRHFDANPQQLERIAASVGALKNAMPKDALLVAFAAEVRNDTPRDIDRMVPVALTAGRQVRYETIYIQRHRLPTGYLAGQFFPIIISTSQPTQPMVLPLEAWTPELIELWKVAGQKTAQAAAAAHKPIARQPQTVHRPAQSYDDGYGQQRQQAPSTGRASPGGNGAASGLQFSNNAPSRVSAAAYGGATSRFEPAPSYPTTPNTGYGVPATPAPANNAPAPNPYAGQIGYSAQGYLAPAPPPPPAPPPAPRLDPAAEAFAQKPLQLTPAAAGSLKLSAGQQPGRVKVRVTAADNVHRLDPVAGEANPANDFVYESAGVTLVVDMNSARSLSGVEVDFGPTPHGIGFVFRRVA
jgi:Fe-S cluster assembly iron-binding protein IscA